MDEPNVRMSVPPVNKATGGRGVGVGVGGLGVGLGVAVGGTGVAGGGGIGLAVGISVSVRVGQASLLSVARMDDGGPLPLA